MMGLFGRIKDKVPKTVAVDKTPKTVTVEQPLLIRNYKQMFPEFANFDKNDTSAVNAKFGGYEKKAEALEDLLTLSISKDTSLPEAMLLKAAGLDLIDHNKIKSSQEGFYKLATKARLQNVFEMFEGTNCIISGFKNVIETKTFDTGTFPNVIYSTISEEITKTLADAYMSGDPSLKEFAQKLRFKVFAIRAKDKDQNVKFAYDAAQKASLQLIYQEKGSTVWRDEKYLHFSKKLSDLCDSDPENLDKSDKYEIARICDRILDASINIGLLTQDERDLIPREASEDCE